MTPEEVRQSITGWTSAGDTLEYTGERSEEGADYALGLRTRGDGGSPVEIVVLQWQGADRITLRHTASIASGPAAEAQRVIDARPGWITGSVDRRDGGTAVRIEAVVYHDGFSRNAFEHAAAEVGRTARLVGGLATGAAAATAPTNAYAQQPLPAPSPAPSPAPTAQAPQPMAAPTFSPQPQPQAQPQYAPQPAQPQWMPSHSVPPQGMRAWAAPDPSGPVVANLAPGLPIQVSEVRGAWARVICSNGWTGWVDGRIIGVAA